MRRVFIGMLLLATTLSGFSQTKNITVSGRIVEGDTKEPVAQATIQLLALPDSAYVAGIATSQQGYFTLPKVKAGKYLLKASYIGLKNKFIPLQLVSATPEKKLGTLTLESDAVMLSEAVITAEAPQVQVVEDTLVYNSSAYRTPEGSMLEELVKKLPGAEIDDDGNVKINGKDLKKIMVDGKEFFGGDVKTGLKNLPVEMIDKLKTYDKKSDLARVTGIDDGEEETVLDLTVKKGMNQGWFGNADLAAGTEDRYMGRLMINRFVDKTQISIIGSANNVNDQGFSSGGGGPRWRRNNGLNASKTAGVNFATETAKLELGGSARYNYSGSDVISNGFTENFLTEGKSYSNSNSKNTNRNVNFNADFRMEWKPDTMTNIIFRPNFSYGNSESQSASESGSFNDDPYLIVPNPNDYLKMKDLDTNDPLRAIRVNAINNGSMSDNDKISADASLQLNRKLNSKGRNITFRGRFGYSNNDNNQYSESRNRYFLLEGENGQDSIRIQNQYSTTPGTNYNYSGRLTYSEPIARATFLQFSYDFQYKYSESDKNVYDLREYPWELGQELPAEYRESRLDSLCKYAEYQYFNHDASVSLRFIRPKYQLNIGMSLQPQHTILTYKKAAVDTTIVRNVVNFAPNVNLRIRFSKVSQLRFNYRGRAGQPSMENLLPTPDYSNPQNIRMGNPGLKPSFTHNMSFFYNNYNAERQQGIVSHVNFSAMENSISNSRVFNPETAGWIVTPKNINGNWNAFGMFGFNTALKNKKYTINTFSNVRYNNSVAYLTDSKTRVENKNTATELTLSERLNGAYRNDWFELGINGTMSYVIEKDKLNPSNNQEPYTYSYGANTTIMAPWRMSLSTNIANQSRRGYSDANMNRDELIWNAQISQTLLKGAATLSFEMYDILRKQSNVSRTMSADGRSVYEYNGVNSYCMVHFIYRLNIFGGKAAREKMEEGGRRRSFSGGHGGFGGGRRF